jgi:hypothetical protein
VRYRIAIVLAGAALVAALVLASLHLNTHPYEPFAIINTGGPTGQINGPAQIPFWTAVREGITSRPPAVRASWQIPVAIVIAVLGIGVAPLVAYRRGSRVPVAPN